MKLIVGLGNPGAKHKNNRHNIGHIVAENLKSQIPNAKIIKTDVFMNESGRFVKSLYTKYKILDTDLYIIHDDLDLSLGTYKIQKGRGPKDHKGLNSIYEVLGTKDFWHVRVGVDNRSPEERISGEEYVLQDFTDKEKKIVTGAVGEICRRLATILKNIN